MIKDLDEPVEIDVLREQVRKMLDNINDEKNVPQGFLQKYPNTLF